MDHQDVAVESLGREVAEFRREFAEFRSDATERFRQADEGMERMQNGLRMLIESVRDDIKLILEHLVPTMRRVDDHGGRISALERSRKKPS